MFQFLKNRFSQPQTGRLGHGFLGSVPDYYRKLHNGVLQEFLCVIIGDTEMFIQFAKYDNGILLDFPLVTKEQVQLKDRMTLFFAEAGITLLEDDSGVDSLQADMPELTESLLLIERLLRDVFQVTDFTTLSFEGA